MKFNGSEKQNAWASKIIESANLNDEQIDNLLKWAGPEMHDQGIMDVSIVIDNRNNLTAYADSLGKFYVLSAEEKHYVAQQAAEAVKQHINSELK